MTTSFSFLARPMVLAAVVSLAGVTAFAVAAHANDSFVSPPPVYDQSDQSGGDSEPPLIDPNHGGGSSGMDDGSACHDVCTDVMAARDDYLDRAHQCNKKGGGSACVQILDEFQQKWGDLYGWCKNKISYGIDTGMPALPEGNVAGACAQSENLLATVYLTE